MYAFPPFASESSIATMSPLSPTSDREELGDHAKAAAFGETARTTAPATTANEWASSISIDLSKRRRQRPSAGFRRCGRSALRTSCADRRRSATVTAGRRKPLAHRKLDRTK
jgi:hypothetical protein